MERHILTKPEKSCAPCCCVGTQSADRRSASPTFACFAVVSVSPEMRLSQELQAKLERLCTTAEWLNEMGLPLRGIGE